LSKYSKIRILNSGKSDAGIFASTDRYRIIEYRVHPNNDYENQDKLYREYYEYDYYSHDGEYFNIYDDSDLEWNNDWVCMLRVEPMPLDGIASQVRVF